MKEQMTEEKITLAQAAQLKAISYQAFRAGGDNVLLSVLDHAGQSINANKLNSPSIGDGHISESFKQSSGWEEQLAALAERERAVLTPMLSDTRENNDDFPTVAEFVAVYSELHHVFDPDNEKGTFYRGVIEQVFRELDLGIMPPKQEQMPVKELVGRLAAEPELLVLCETAERAGAFRQ